MAANQEAQQMARDELYSVVGRDRLPTYEDQDSLPYIEAIFRECMRWMPVLPLGITHSVIEDDVYGDYFIPSGTGIIPVCTSSHHASKTDVRILISSPIERLVRIRHIWLSTISVTTGTPTGTCSTTLWNIRSQTNSSPTDFSRTASSIPLFAIRQQ